MTHAAAAARATGRARGRSAAVATAVCVLSLLSLVGLLVMSPLEPGATSSFASSSTSNVLAGLGAALFGLSFTAVGFVVARRQPRNPMGWLLLGVAISIDLGSFAPAYAYYDFTHHRSLPLEPVAVLLSGLWIFAFLLLPLVVLLFPDGSLGSRWRWPLRVYLLLAAFFTVAMLRVAIAGLSLRMPVDSQGNLAGLNHPGGWVGLAQGLGLVGAGVTAIAAIARQVLGFRRAGSVRRQQLKWLMGGAAVCLLTELLTIVWSSAPSIVSNLAFPIGFAVLPLSIGVGILRYRLYEIDRLISRTLAYLILTALLVGTFVGLIALTTDTLALSGRVGVAASTLAAAALFNPLRRRIQRAVDRRFNRARYNAEATVAAFTARLRDAVEIDAIAADLRDAVNRAVAPTHTSVWIKR